MMVIIVAVTSGGLHGRFKEETVAIVDYLYCLHGKYDAAIVKAGLRIACLLNGLR